MTIDERIKLVQLLSTYLGEGDVTDRHIVLDKVSDDLLLKEAEGMYSELDLSILAGVALGGIDCRLVFTDEECECPATRLKMRVLVEDGFAILVESLG